MKNAGLKKKLLHLEKVSYKLIKTILLSKQTV